MWRYGYPMDYNSFLAWQQDALEQQLQYYSFYVPQPTFYARKKRPTVPQGEESLLGFTNEELQEMGKRNKDMELDEDTYDMKKKLGRLPRANEYIIRVSLKKGDVRLVRTLNEKRQWDSESLAPAAMLFKKYRAVLDPDGIHARVELDPNALLVKRCPNCLKLISLDDIDVAMSNKAVFCNKQCKAEYAKKKRLNEIQIEKVRQEMSAQTKRRLEEIRKMIYGIQI